MSLTENGGQISHSLRLYDRFEWTADGLDKGRVESPGFTFDGVVWHMAVSFGKNESSGDISLTMWRTLPGSGSRCAVKVGVRRKNGTDGLVVNCQTDADGFLELRKFVPGAELSRNKARIFPGGRLTIFCEMRAEKMGDRASELGDLPTNLLIQNLKDLCLNGRNSDVVLKVEGKEFKAHKAILGSRCPVFARMFDHDMKENSSGVVDIPDCSADAFQALLLFLYTGKREGCTLDTVNPLYYAADKYGVQELKEYCVKFMIRTLSVDTFCDVVMTALRHSESELLEAASAFFAENVKIIIKTVKWQQYLKENPIHANELYIKAIDA